MNIRSKTPEELDNDAVDDFAAALKAKLAIARAKGRSGWETCTPEDLSAMLREHVEKGDPRDVANFCMFLWITGAPILPAPYVPKLNMLSTPPVSITTLGPATVSKTEYVYLVEEFLGRQSTGNYLETDGPTCHKYSVTKDPHKAHRFASRAHAVSAIATLGLNERPAEAIFEPFRAWAAVQHAFDL